MQKRDKVLVTGANGFIGRPLSCKLHGMGYQVVAATRHSDSICEKNKIFEEIKITDIFSDKFKLNDVNSIIHCAARAHTPMQMDGHSSLQNYRAVNVEFTKSLAERAAEAGVQRFIFFSSVGVLGNNTNNRPPFSFKDPPCPMDEYALTKLEAEQALREVALRSGMDFVIIRSPLVYGPNAKGNFARLLKMINLGLPLPFGGIDNSRSYIGIDNLIDFVTKCLEHPAASGETFLVSDDHDLSTTELIIRISDSMGIDCKLFPVSVPMLTFVAGIFGRKKDIRRLTGDLKIDIQSTKEILGWTPKINLDEGIRKMVAHVVI